MLITHCADIHLDSPMKTHLDRRVSEDRKAELLLAFKNMVNKSRELGSKIILISGDLFDNPSPTKKCLNAFKSIILNNSDIVFLYITGNHDYYQIEDMPENFKTFSSSWMKYSFEDVDIYGLNGTLNGDYLYESFNADENKKNIVMLHDDVTLYSFKDGIKLKKLMGKSIDYLALGHIHLRSLEKLDERGIYAFPGALEGRGFDEEGVKGFYLIDTNDITNPKFIPNSIRVIHKLSLDITGLNDYSDIEKEVSNHVKDIKKDDIVEVILEGSYELSLIKQNDLLAQELNDKFYFAKVKDISNLHIDPMSYQHDVSLKGEFIREVLASDLDESLKAKIIETGIEALSGGAK